MVFCTLLGPTFVFIFLEFFEIRIHIHIDEYLRIRQDAQIVRLNYINIMIITLLFYHII
jgi:hypothetical protein